MSELKDIENLAKIARVTCGWKKPSLDLALVRPYWRDAHSPAIARRDGVYEYRHYPLDPIRPALFGPVDGIDCVGKPDEQLMWLSDVRYADQAGLDAFGASPPPDEKAQILADIEMIVDKSTTYKVIGANACTLLDLTGDGAPVGPVAAPTFSVFFRQKATEVAFRVALRALATSWTQIPGVRRVRINLFEVPDMEAERAAGYPVKTHPPQMQYQAWVDLVLQSESVAPQLLATPGANAYLAEFSAMHAYPVPAIYTFNYRGRPTIAGLRGFAAHAAIEALDARHQKNARLLEWMYGPIARGVTQG